MRPREGERLILGHTANVLVPSSQFLKVNHEDYFLITIRKFGFQSARDQSRVQIGQEIVVQRKHPKSFFF